MGNSLPADHSSDQGMMLPYLQGYPEGVVVSVRKSNLRRRPALEVSHVVVQFTIGIAVHVPEALKIPVQNHLVSNC
jgi:hypothetical protein